MNYEDNIELERLEEERRDTEEKLYEIQDKIRKLREGM